MRTRSGPRSFDAFALGNQETDAWAGYHRHESGRSFVSAVGTVRAGFGMGTRVTRLPLVTEG